jgi:hypothetical protein
MLQYCDGAIAISTHGASAPESNNRRQTFVIEAVHQHAHCRLRDATHAKPDGLRFGGTTWNRCNVLHDGWAIIGCGYTVQPVHVLPET